MDIVNNIQLQCVYVIATTKRLDHQRTVTTTTHTIT